MRNVKWIKFLKLLVIENQWNSKKFEIQRAVLVKTLERENGRFLHEYNTIISQELVQIDRAFNISFNLKDFLNSYSGVLIVRSSITSCWFIFHVSFITKCINLFLTNSDQGPCHFIIIVTKPFEILGVFRKRC